jgi:hypothetical protein
MTDPPRLRDDPDAPSDLQRALREEADAPSDYDVEEGLKRFHRGSGGGGSAIGIKSLAGVGGAVAVAAFLAVMSARSRSTSPNPSPSPVATTPSASAPDFPVPSPVDSKKTLPEPPPISSEAPTPAPSAELVPRLADSHVAPKSREATLREEIEQLRRIRAESSPSRALALADEGHRLFPGGTLYQDREAIAIRSLATLGRMGEARARGSAFVTRFPRSPYAEQIRKELNLGDAGP